MTALRKLKTSERPREGSRLSGKLANLGFDKLRTPPRGSRSGVKRRKTLPLFSARWRAFRGKGVVVLRESPNQPNELQWRLEQW